MLIVSLIPLSLVGVLSYFQAENALRDAAFTTQDVFAQQKEQIIEGWFSDLTASARIAASTRSTYNSMTILSELDGNTEEPAWQERVSMMDEGFSVMALKIA